LVKKIRIPIRDEQTGSYLRELKTIFGIKYLNSFVRIRDQGWEKIRIRDQGWEKFGSGIKIPDPQHCSVPNKYNTELQTIFNLLCSRQKRTFLICGQTVCKLAGQQLGR
jgi:hypothetical protein